MMRSVLLGFVFVLSFIGVVFGDGPLSPVSAYNPVYFIAGDYQSEVKVQMSFKYSIFHPWKVGLYAGYNQLMFWDLYKNSNPFRQIDFNPELFWRFDSKNNFLGDVDLVFVDYFQLGLFDHKSNGDAGVDSRGFDRCYAQIQCSFGSFLNAGFNFKYFYIFPGRATENPDIQDYIGSFETKFFIKLKGEEDNVDYEELYASFGAGGGINGGDISKGWQEYGLKIRPVLSRVRPYIQYWTGYAESMLTYNKRSSALRIGLIFE